MLNRVILIGRLTRDPDLRYTPQGNAVCNFSIAVNRVGSDEADFFNIVCWRKTAENVAQYLKKGRLVAVEGRLQQRRYQTASGENRSVVEVLAEKVVFLEKSEDKPDKAELPFR